MSDIQKILQDKLATLANDNDINEEQDSDEEQVVQ